MTRPALTEPILTQPSRPHPADRVPHRTRHRTWESLRWLIPFSSHCSISIVPCFPSVTAQHLPQSRAHSLSTACQVPETIRARASALAHPGESKSSFSPREPEGPGWFCLIVGETVLAKRLLSSTQEI